LPLKGAILQKSHGFGEGMITATLKMTIPIRKHREALRILRPAVDKFRDEPGCLSCGIYRDMKEKNLLMLQETWRSEKDLGLHLRSEEYRKVLLVLEMALKQPEIRFDTVTTSTGIGTIEKARGAVREPVY